jgi:hypothetical protein
MAGWSTLGQDGDFRGPRLGWADIVGGDGGGTLLFIILLGPSKNQVIRRRTVLHLEEHMQSKSGIRISTCRIRTGDHAVRRQTFYPTGLSDTTDRKRCTMTHPARPLLPRTHAGTIMLASFGYGVEWCGINDQAYLLLGFIQMEERGYFHICRCAASR